MVKRLSRWTVKVGDLVKMKRGYSEPGLVLEMTVTNLGRWVRVFWPDYAHRTQNRSLERHKDLEVWNEGR